MNMNSGFFFKLRIKFENQNFENYLKDGILKINK